MLCFSRVFFKLPYDCLPASSNGSAGDGFFVVLLDALGESLAMAAWMPLKKSMSSSLLCFLTTVPGVGDPLASDLMVKEAEHLAEPPRGARRRTMSADANKFSGDFTKIPCLTFCLIDMCSWLNAVFHLHIYLIYFLVRKKKLEQLDLKENKD